MQERTYAPKSTGNSYTLTQRAEIIRGQASQVLLLADRLQHSLGIADPEKVGDHPERAIAGPADIIENAGDDLSVTMALLEKCLAYIGQPGEGAGNAPRIR